nr:reverse transcriptase domain-containing protein [Tanacetum cinerariifolium]
MHTRASNSELVEPLPVPEHTLNQRLRRPNRKVLLDQRNNPPQHPRIVYLPILNVNYFHHFLDILQNYNPMDDEPMWVADHVVALTLSNIIKIFYHGLSEITQEVLNAAAGGIFLNKTPNQAYQLLEDKVFLKLDWAKNQKTKSSLKKTVAFVDEGSDFSKIARTLTKLLEKDTLFEFDDECQKAFELLKENLTCALVIVSLNWNLPFELMCDASDFAVGVVLGQEDGKNFHPIYFTSKTLNLTQQKYTITGKELMVVVFVFDKFRSYLILLKTIIHTDHSALNHLFKKQDAKPHLIRWILLLQEFNIEIKDRKDDNFPRETLMEINTKDEQWFADFANYLVANIIPKRMTYQQKNKFFSDLKHYFWEEPYLLKVCSDGMIRRYVSGPETQTILEQCHHGPTGGHYGPYVTAEKGNISKRDEMPLNNIQVYKFFDMWGIDFMGPFPKSHKFKYILVAADYVSKWTKAQALPTNDARVVVTFLKKLFCRFRMPKALISDRGTHFCNKIIEKTMKRYGVNHRFSTSYHPQTSGQVENMNRALKRILEKTVKDNPAIWSRKLDDALWAFRTAYKNLHGPHPRNLYMERTSSYHLKLNTAHTGP